MSFPPFSSLKQTVQSCWKDWACEGFALLVVVGFCLFMAWPMIEDWNMISSYLGDPDGLVQQSYVVPIVEGFWKFREYPLWNPYFGGGMPWAGYVYNPGISLITPIYIKYGVIQGIKIWCALVLCLSGIGLYWCCRWWGECARPWAVAGAIFYVGNLWIPLQMDSGNYDLLMLHALPMYGALFKGLLDRKWYGLLLPLLFQMSFAQAKYAPFIAGAFILLLAIMWAGNSAKRLAQGVGLVLAASTAGAIISMPKLIPFLNLFQSDRVNQSAMAEQFTLSYRSFEDYIANISGYTHTLHSYNHVGAIGWFPIVFALIGVGLNLNKAKYFIVPLVVFSLICLGDYSPIPLSKILRELPLFDTMFSFPKYWLNGILACYCILMAIALQGLEGKFQDRKSLSRLVFLAVMVALMYASLKPIVVHGRSLMNYHFSTFVVRKEVPEFYQMSTRSLSETITRYRILKSPQRTIEAEQLQNLLNGIGTVTWYGNLIFDENVEPKLYVEPDKSITENPAYRGEIYLEDESSSAELQNYHFSFNTQNFSYSATEPVLVVINQNWNQEWKTNVGTVTNTRGLLSVQLPAGSGDVRLSFHSWRFKFGLWVGFLGGISWLAWGVFWVRGVKGSSQSEGD
ncbi:MAG: hypothetical protein ACFCU1_01945 [Sumerlaeia bacterium]